MKYKIVVDSCCELPENLKNDEKFESVPLVLTVEGEDIIDDATFDQASFLKKVADSPNCPKSSCPSPERYMKTYECDAERIYVVTLSAELSGSYNSAVLGKNLFQEEYPEVNVHVFNSRSASIGETLIALKIVECEEAGLPFEETVAVVEKYIETQHTFFVLENLETLRKNGRLGLVKGLVASALKIKPVMGSTDEGTICQLGQTRGMNKALVKMVDFIIQKTTDSENKVLAISHCNCPERAEILKEAILERMKLKDIIILDTRGVSSMYANDGGVIVAV
ncbi:MAG: DegV family protein [Lachnospiraceae bacterium]|nr:DegV family protein [Lachnospiraceae bacterium]MDD6617174.1 DegV family protein [Clostridiales bacterium]MDY4771552.1 DegV family protein [Lachnospiraceae bacterium]